MNNKKGPVTGTKRAPAFKCPFTMPYKLEKALNEQLEQAAYKARVSKSTYISQLLEAHFALEEDV